MGYEMTKLVVDIIFGVCLLGLGLYYLLTPFEKLKEKYPKMKSEKMIKGCGVLIVVIGAIVIIMGVLGLI
ncbi:MAG: hypothetical protein NC429_14745 [Lachnospiraceae bacterium]|nr:hypothetical protein [Lachnospiraceae bacterium]